jgi:transcription elongation factor SPT6
LYIVHPHLEANDIDNNRNDVDGPDPLDHTRIHPSDYGLAHEIVENVLQLDPEDAQEQNPSIAVLQLWSEGRVGQRMNGLDIEAFAEEVQRRKGTPQRVLLNYTVGELAEPYQDSRRRFIEPDEYDVLRMLTGETLDTVGSGKIVTAHVSAVKRDAAFIKLDSGMTGEIPLQYLADGAQDARDIVTKSQAVRGVVVLLRPNDLYVELSVRHSDVARALDEARKQNRGPNFAAEAEAVDKIAMEKQKRVREAGLPRVIDHPAWKHVNKVQAEALLEQKHRGDVVIRPSSHGFDHIAVTWKVDDGIYQHIGQS